MNILKALRKEHARIQHQAESLVAAIAVLDGAGPRHKSDEHKAGRKKGWHMSAAAKAKIGRAQRARWKEIARRKKASALNGGDGRKKHALKGRHLSAAHKKAIREGIAKRKKLRAVA